MLRAILIALCLATAMVVAPARADQVWDATPDGVLDQMRGGFALPDGLMVAFGIVRTVQVDGVIVSQTSLNIPDLRSITADQAQQLGRQVTGLGLGVVQTGTGNTLEVPQTQTLPGIVIQNTESNRTLQAITEITATTNSMRMLQGLNLNQALSDALKLGR